MRALNSNKQICLVQFGKTGGFRGEKYYETNNLDAVMASVLAIEMDAESAVLLDYDFNFSYRRASFERLVVRRSMA